MNEPLPSIFIVEDEALIALELRDRMSMLGYHVTGVRARGEDALVDAAAATAELVLMDVNLAGQLDGIETAQRLRAQYGTGIIFLTAYSDQALLERARQAEPLGYLVKPFDERELHAMLQTALYRHRLERAQIEFTGQLEQRVAERTADLQQTNAQLAASQSRLQFLLQQSPSVIYTCRPDGDFGATFVSDNLRTLLGYEPNAFTADPGFWAERIHPVDQPRVFAELIRLFDVGTHSHEYRFRHRDGTYRWLHDDLSLVRDAEGTPLEIVGSMVDITERKQAEVALVKARDEAERANAAKSEFLSRMSHELRTPLNAILGFGQLLEMEVRDARQAEDVQEILKAGQHLLAQVNEILDLARIDSGRIKLTLEPVGVAAAVADCLAQLRPIAEPRGLAMNAIIDAALVVQADHTRLKQVLLNLISNAIKYNRDGGRIDVTACVEKGRARIAVRDTGRGIAPEKLERLFKPFERIETISDNIEGSGIGLALVKRLVEAMGGEVGLDSEVGNGSTFWFTLPAANLSVLCETAAPKVSADGTANSTYVAKEPQHRVLYIEDNRANIMLVRKIFDTRSEFVLLEAMNAELGLEIARRERPDLILLNIHLPGMDGYAALAQLKAWPETVGIPVIAITANAMPRDIERSRAVGFADYLTKPLEVGQFLESVNRCLVAGGISKAATQETTDGGQHVL